MMVRRLSRSKQYYYQKQIFFNISQRVIGLARSNTVIYLAKFYQYLLLKEDLKRQ